MSSRGSTPGGQRGQVIVLFAGGLIVVVLLVGLVVDGGYGLAQRRASQNAADFAALAGARVVAQWIAGDAVNGTDATVRAAITRSVAANGGTAVTFGAPNGPQYVGSNGGVLGYVGSGSIPSGAAGVRVRSSRSWRPFFLGAIGVNNWTASAEATARGGYAATGPGTGVFPAGIAQAFFEAFPFCSGPVSTDPNSPCYPRQLTPGNLNVPGGFGWLSFGCSGYGLGQDGSGCANSKPFLQEEIGPPSNSHGCCTLVGLPGSPDKVKSLPGNKVSADCSYWINTGATVTVPVWDVAGGTGANAWYHVIGFAGFQITECRGGKDIAGVWRQQFFLGPTTTTAGFTGQALAVQLVR
jgi:hypothetical protein